MMAERRGKNTQLPLPDLLRQSIYSRERPFVALVCGAIACAITCTR
jgi:hypothetical protein